MNGFRPLNEQELERIREREKNATPGAWTVNERKVDEFLTERGINAQESNQTATPVIGTFHTGTTAGTWIGEADAEFIAQARMDIPALLSTLDVFGHQVVYEALIHYIRRGLFDSREGKILEQAMETAWRIIGSQKVTPADEDTKRTKRFGFLRK